MERGKPQPHSMMPVSANTLFDKLVLFLCCLAVYFLVTADFSYVPVLVVVTFSAFNTYFEKRFLVRVTAGAYLMARPLHSRLVLFHPRHDV